MGVHSPGGGAALRIPFTEQIQALIPQKEYPRGQPWRVPSVPSDLDKKLAAFLKKQRGEMSYAAFAKKTGFTASSLFRLEQGQQSITLGRLHELMKRLKVTLGDVFGR